MDDLKSDADLCVKCGLCLPHCPTYRHTGNENESPRGRIALIQAYAEGHLDATPKLIGHIDNCLLCRACEKVCPAEVPYGRLIDRFRSRAKNHQSFSLATSLIKKIAVDKRYNPLAQRALRFYLDSPLANAAKRLGTLRLLGMGAVERLLPVISENFESLQDYYPAQGVVKGCVGLFKGCLGTLLDQAPLNAAIRCFTAAGFNVHVPSEQTCCGALDLHDGNSDSAALLAEINCRAFAEPRLDAIVTIASGCGAHLKEYENSTIAAKVIDSSLFLSQYADFSDHLKPLSAHVCLHTPCSLKNVMREEQGALNLLRRIPELRISELSPSMTCCGAAGSYVLKHPKVAKVLVDDVLNAVIDTQADTLVTSNIGCALHIAAGLREKGLKMQVVHPLILVSQQFQ